MSDQKTDELEAEEKIELPSDAPVADELSDEALKAVSGGLPPCASGQHIPDGHL